MSLVTRLLPDNPVLTKELRVRMRGSKAYWILLLYLGFLSLVMLLNYWSWQRNVTGGNGGASEASRLGGEIFIWIVLTQMFLVLFITPAITSGSLTIEREQQTMDLLTMTRLTRRSIISGKLLSAISFTALLLVSSLPLISICFMLGSVDPGMVVSNYMMMLMGSFLIGAMGLMWSSIARTTTQAVLFTYSTLFVLFVFGAMTYSLRFDTGTSGEIPENVMRCISQTWFGNRFLGIPGPDGIGFALMSALGGLLMAAIAMTRLDMWPERRASLLRGLTLLLVAIQLLAVDVWWLNAWYSRGAGAVQIAVQPPITVLIITAMLLMLLVPIFATGELLPVEARRIRRYLIWSWTPKGLSRGKLGSALPFLTLLTLFCLGLYVLAFVFVGKTPDILHSARTTQNTAPSAQAAPITRGLPAASTATTVSARAAQEAGDFPQAVVVIVASVIGYSLFCICLSILFRNRWIAWMLATLFLFAVWILPEIARFNMKDIWIFGPVINLYYFNPVQALVQMSDPLSYFSMRPLLFGQAPMWQMTTFVWGFVGLVSALVTARLVAREAKSTVAVPYEELAAEF